MPLLVQSYHIPPTFLYIHRYNVLTKHKTYQPYTYQTYTYHIHPPPYHIHPHLYIHTPPYIHIHIVVYRGALLSDDIAEGTKLLSKRARFQIRVLYLRPDGSNVKYGLRGWLGSCAMILALRAMALLLRSERLVCADNVRGQGGSTQRTCACLMILIWTCRIHNEV